MIGQKPPLDTEEPSYTGPHEPEEDDGFVDDAQVDGSQK